MIASVHCTILVVRQCDGIRLLYRRGGCCAMDLSRLRLGLEFVGFPRVWPRWCDVVPRCGMRLRLSLRDQNLRSAKTTEITVVGVCMPAVLALDHGDLYAT